VFSFQYKEYENHCVNNTADQIERCEGSRRKMAFKHSKDD